MIKKLARFVGQYKKNAILGPLFLLGEVFMDIFQPFVVASLIDKGIQAQNTAVIFRYGALMIGCAMMSLFLGAMSGVHSSIATTGFAANVRDALRDMKHVVKVEPSIAERARRAIDAMLAVS